MTKRYNFFVSVQAILIPGLNDVLLVALDVYNQIWTKLAAGGSEWTMQPVPFETVH